MRTAVAMTVLAALLVPLAFGGADEARQAYLEKASALERTDATGHYLLGLWCRQAGLTEEARLEFERVVALEPDHEGARRELGYERVEDGWLAHEEAMLAKGLVRYEGAWMLPEEVAVLTLPQTERERRKEEEGKVRAFLRKMVDGGPKVERIAEAALAGVPDASKVDPLAYALRYPAEHVRTFAAAELGRIGDRRALRPLVYRSLVDPSEAVRAAAISAVRTFNDPNLLAPYAKALFSENQALRINAAEAIGELQQVLGIEYLLYRLRAHGGGLTRSHIYLAKQLSFIQDFDVEVAQTAFIADPIVGILQEGQVLDVRVLSTERTADLLERRVIRTSLRKLTGVDHGEDVVAWSAWWAENRDRLLAAGK